MLRNAEVNTFLQQLVNTQQEETREMFSVGSVLNNIATGFFVRSSRKLYNATLVVFARVSESESLQ
jgi:hypothetical protein